MPSAVEEGFSNFESDVFNIFRNSFPDCLLLVRCESFEIVSDLLLPPSAVHVVELA
jgi:hypothetical protein